MQSKRDARRILLLVTSLLALAISLRASTEARQIFVTPTGEAQNVRFEQVGNGVVNILYDLVSSDARAVFSVLLEASQDRGATFGMRPQSVTGDVGSGVRPGPGKRIAWESGKDVERVQIDQFRFRIIATAGPLTVETRPAAPAASSARTGAIAITSSPAGAQVSVDGKALGVTPLSVPELSPGSHRVAVTLAGYVEGSRSVDVSAGQVARVDFSLKADPQAATSPSAAAPPKKGSSKFLWIGLAGAGAAGAAVAAGGGGAKTTPTPGPVVVVDPVPTRTVCAFSVSPTSLPILNNATTSFSITVSPAGCTNPAWQVTLPSFCASSTTSGSGTATVGLTCDTNNDQDARTGSFVAAGQTVSYTQLSACSYNVVFVDFVANRQRTVVGFGAGASRVIDVVPSIQTCRWSVGQPASWLQIDSTGGTGSARVTARVIQANGGAVRTTNFFIAGVSLEVRQCAAGQQSNSAGECP